MSAEEKAIRAASFGSVADAYERGRPSYPTAAISWALGERSLRVADVGAGTGKLTQALVRAGHEVVAIEPLAEMRVVLAERHPQVELLDGRAEALPLADGSVDAVVAGSAFHWFDWGPAFAEIARVLRGAGMLAMLGNGFEDDAQRWVAGLREILGPGPLGRADHWPEDSELGRWFVEVADHSFAHPHPVTLPTLLDFALSRSSVAILEEAERGLKLRAIERLWQEQVGSERAILPYRTAVRRATGLRAR
ncbi:MAG TPA: class I SAM-dependent methyltransferase [Solirubrobacteraceae bacterium]|nr:class I SAM-dependent methyltransferase [Solirubrobacteraceae bacterium]